MLFNQASQHFVWDKLLSLHFLILPSHTNYLYWNSLNLAQILDFLYMILPCHQSGTADKDRAFLKHKITVAFDGYLYMQTGQRVQWVIKVSMTLV
jgi:hypothetical protein